MDGSNRAILIVETDEDSARAEAKILEGAGYSVKIIRASASALKAASEGRFDLILLHADFEKAVGGADAVRKLVEAPDVPVVLVLAPGAGERPSAAGESGCYGVYVRDSGAAALLCTVSAALRLHETNRGLRENETFFRERENFLDSIIDNIPSMVFVKDADDLRFVKINRKAEQVLGFRREELIGRTDYDVFTEAQARFFREIDKNVLSKQEITDIPEETIRTKDRGEIFLHTKKIPVFGRGGKALFLVGISEDITEAKKARENLIRSEARFRSYFDLPLVGLSITSPGKRWIDANDKLCAMLGYTKKELTERTWAEMTFPEDLAKDDGLFDSLLKGDIPSYSMDKRYIRKDGSLLWASIAVGCVRDRSGEVEYAVAVIQDISDRVKLESGLAEAVKQREMLLKELQHRVKNTLLIVSGILYLESEKMDDEPARRAFANAQSRIASITEVYKRLYESSDLKNIDLRPYIETLASSIFSSYGADGGRLTYRFDLDDAKLDPKRSVTLGLILNELLTNAVKYAYPGEGGGEVRIELRNTDGLLILSVSDDGAGIPQDYDPADKGSTGLNLVRMLADELEGSSIEISSKKGTTIRLSFSY